MTAFIEEAPIHIPADAWAFLAGHPHPQEVADLEAKVREYLAKGGTITEVPVGATAAPEDKPLYGFAKAMSQGYTADQVEAHYAKRQRKATLKDLALVAHIEALLPQDTRAELARAIGVSDCKLVRLLQEHLSDNVHAKRLLESRRDSSAKLDKVREALDMGLIGYERVRKYAGISYNHLKKLEREHRLRILKDVGGFRKAEQESLA